MGRNKAAAKKMVKQSKTNAKIVFVSSNLGYGFPGMGVIFT